MALDVSGPAKGLCGVLNPGGTLNSTTWVRSGGTFVGGVAAVQPFMVATPYEGATPLLLVSSVPVIAQIDWDGAGCHRMNGTLEAFYLHRTVDETGLSLAQLDHQMASDCTAIIAAILGAPTLGGSVVTVNLPIEVERDPRGLFIEWQGAAWVFCSLRIPFIGLPF